MIEVAMSPPSPNHSGARKQPISCIVIHDTGSNTAASALDWLRRPEAQASAHVVIDLDGTVYRLVPDNLVAWHAGKSSLWGIEGVNAFSLGVELVDASESSPYPSAQLRAAAEWVAEACVRHVIPLNRVVGHCHVAPGRKVDPGKDFPWEYWLRDVSRRITEKRMASGVAESLARLR